MKKALSIFMSIVIVFVLVVPVTVSAEENNFPMVVVSGMNFAGLSVDTGTENQKPAIAEIKTDELIISVMKSIAKGVVTMNLNEFVDGVCDYVYTILGSLSCDKSGNSLYNVSLKKFPLSVAHYDELLAESYPTNETGIVKAAADRYGADNTYFYVYDWRLSPLENCDGLNEMIQLALKESGKSKVNLACCSMGGVETVAYMTKYGYDKINSCVFLSTAFYGTYVATDLLNGEITLGSDAVSNFLGQMVKGNESNENLIKVLKYTGVISGVCSLGNGIVDMIKDRVFEKFLRDSFGTMPVLWALVEPDKYETGLDFTFGSDKDEYSELIKKTDELQKMMKDRDELLEEARKSGVKLSFVANYNVPLIPVYERSATQGDGVLETAMVSGGATVSDIGTTLSEKYLATADKKYISPDNTIDASTCLYPEYTWFVKDAPHIACRYKSTYSDFAFWLIESSVQPTVRQNPLYPQFMYADSMQNIYTY